MHIKRFCANRSKVSMWMKIQWTKKKRNVNKMKDEAHVEYDSIPVCSQLRL